MELDEWKRKNSQARRYAHFDEKVNLNQVFGYISNPDKVAKHSFYPFIHYTARFTRFSKRNGKKNKEREICYSAHIDRYIFQYYGYLLNEVYNKYADAIGINNVAIAYRNNLHKNNIHFAKEAFDFICSQSQCYILVGDFTNFFDSLAHDYLKERLCELLDVKILSEDYYAVYKNITRYASWELSDLLELNGLSNRYGDIKKLNEKRRVIAIDVFRENKNRCIKVNKKSYGIPQGSSISAVLSNIYMINFDKVLNEYAKTNGGLYLRYSDDFIFILPQSDDYMLHYDFLISEIDKVKNLDLQPDKTQGYVFSNGMLRKNMTESCDEHTSHHCLLNYLGFSFDGSNITIRDKTISKYYYRMYRKIRGIKNRSRISPLGRRISLNKLYGKFSKKGGQKYGKRTEKRSGNFLDYVDRASKIIGQETNIKRSTRRHMYKIKQHLDK